MAIIFKNASWHLQQGGLHYERREASVATAFGAQISNFFLRLKTKMLWA